MAIFRDFNPLDHDRAIEDRRRHKQLVEKCIKENLGDIFSEESIVGENKNKKYKIPIKGLKEYQFIFGKNGEGAAIGTGGERRGEELSSGRDKQQGKKGSSGAGNEEGEEVYETEVTLEEILDYLIEDLELPNLDAKKYSNIVVKHHRKRRGYQRYGIKPSLSKKRTVIEKIKRKQGNKRVNREETALPKRFPFKEEDLRYYKVRISKKKQSNAVIIFIMDTSGSMDTTKKFLARSFFYVLSRFIKKKYEQVEIKFISHTTIAKLVSEIEFFHKGESGGTYISSGFYEALNLIKNHYSPTEWNVYCFYASDGDNWSEDNERAFTSGRELSSLCNLLGYVEIMPAHYANTIKDKLVKEITNSAFIAASIKKKNELWPALKAMLKKGLVEV